ncbi:MAG: DUF4271 domain-containing protein [Bacteroidales bacterium]|nr:DUF4271 domain-containing protein [Bacteroidales bacterium]MBN2750040.1 DUF4271 domain-containing protein [Bacteroidales bacterium]
MNAAFIKPLVTSQPAQAFQDTVKPVSTVTLSSMDSLFHAAEVKRRQVDSVKKSIAIRSVQRVVEKKPEPVVYDSLPPVHLSLEAKASASFFFPDSYIPRVLSDSIFICSAESAQGVSQKSEGVLVETVESGEVGSTELSVKAFTQSVLPNWIFGVAIAFLVIFALVRIKYWKYVAEIFEGIIYGYAGEKLFRDRNIPFLRVSSILDVLFFGSTSVIVYLYLKSISVDVFADSYSFLLFGAILGILLLFRLIRFFAHRTLAFVTDSRSFFLEIYHHGVLYPRGLAVISVPLAFFIAYSEPAVARILFYTYAVTVALLLLLRLFRFAYVFLKKGFSLFYFLLYLCALEIPPVLILWKELFGKQ